MKKEKIEEFVNRYFKAFSPHIERNVIPEYYKVNFNININGNKKRGEFYVIPGKKIPNVLNSKELKEYKSKTTIDLNLNKKDTEKSKKLKIK